MITCTLIDAAKRNWTGKTNLNTTKKRAYGNVNEPEERLEGRSQNVGNGFRDAVGKECNYRPTPVGVAPGPPGEAVTHCHQTIYVDPGLMWSDSRPIVF